MSVPTNTKQSITLAQFEDNYIQGLYDEDHIVYLGGNSSGTTVLVKRRFDLQNRRLTRGRYLKQTLLISDLLGGVIGQRGEASLTIALSNSAVATIVTLPQKIDAVANWLVYVSVVNDETVGLKLFSAKAEIVTTSTVRIRLVRQFSNIVLGGDTETNIDSAGLSSFEQIVGANHQHGIDDGSVYPEATGHNHRLGAFATSTFNNTGEAAVTVKVNWVLIHV